MAVAQNGQHGKTGYHSTRYAALNQKSFIIFWANHSEVISKNSHFPVGADVPK